ncbi:MAG: nucleotidyltransferase domain-containing protein [Spirochaetota bacterium]|nr:nucleotidyltransferase domain-containing protein [Spirochaetota bacterium]
MRLTVSEINTIKSSIYDEDDNAEIYLFGSRTDDSKRGGDIDILILSSKINFSDVTKIKRKILIKLKWSFELEFRQTKYF